MKVIPNVIHRPDSDAERKVFNLLKSIDFGKGWTAFHSLNVSEHAYKQWSELDFVIVGPFGVMILEVKGGRVACDDGMWLFTDRYDVVHKKTEGPFKQAETGMYALQKKIDANYGKDWRGYLKTGWGVVFPDIPFTVPSPEMPQEVVCDQHCVKDADSFKKYLRRLFTYWNDKGARLKPLSTDSPFLEYLTNYLRPNFDVAPSLHNRIDVIQQEIVQHTKDQYKFLDALEGHDRIICSGGAGTGKSFVAVEAARRELDLGYRVLIVALSDIFISYLKVQLEHENLKVCTFSNLESSIQTVEQQPVDVLIVDEGQDLISLAALDVFERAVKGGINKGRWRWFMDENAQAGIIGECDDESIEILKLSGAVYMSLKYNCRNTPQIISETEAVTGAYVGITEIKGAGPKVKYCEVLDKDNEVECLVDHIQSLCEDGVELSDIVVLSPVEQKKSVVSLLPAKWKKRLRCINTTNVMNTANGVLLFSSIADFKGLERRFVLLVDTGELSNSKESISLLYVAMTRAHAGLWVAVDSKFKPTLIDMQKKNLIKGMKK
jgi:hypothetical protein